MQENWLHPDDRHLMGTLLANGEHADEPITLLVLPKHGGVKWIELSRSVIHDDSGQPVAIEGIVRDVTGRVQQDDALRRSEERFRLLADNAQDMIYRYRVAEPQGHHVTHAADGASVLAALDEQEFDVIVMDVQMPDMDGLQLTTSIRKRERPGAKRVSIVALTAHSVGSYRQRCLDAGMDDYLSKPLQVDQLNRALERQSLARVA